MKDKERQSKRQRRTSCAARIHLSFTEQNAMNKIMPLLVLSIVSISKSDIPWVPYYEESVLFTNEMIISLEKGFTSNLSLLAWGGKAFITTRNNTISNTAGYELASEVRLYSQKGKWSGLFLGSYYGFGWMETPETYQGSEVRKTDVTGSTFGAKCGYKLLFYSLSFRQINPRFDIEPYMSISTSSYSDGFMDFKSPTIWTYGLRFILEILHPSQQMIKQQ